MSKRTMFLAPLSFDEAVTDLLKVKPQPKAKAKRKPVQVTLDAKPLEDAFGQIQLLLEKPSQAPPEVIDLLIDLAKPGSKLATIEPTATMRAGKVVVTLKPSDRLAKLLFAARAGKID